MLPMCKYCQFQFPITNNSRPIGNIGIGNWQHFHNGNIQHVVPIPGMRSDARIEENLGAADVALSPEELAAIEAELAKITIHGNRTDEDIQRMGYVKAQ